MASPAAEIDLAEPRLRSLLAAQHADLADLPLAELDAGWDNMLWRLGDELLFRLPRRRTAAPLLLNEQRWLPEIAPRLPLPVPVPVRVGRPSEEFPWPWSVVPWLHGTPGDRATLTDPDESARRLGLFLLSLHEEAPVDAPRNPHRSVTLAQRTLDFEARLTDLAPGIDQRAARRVWDRALSARPSTLPPVWIHGDLHPANVLVERGALCAVLDFGDVCAGDPATDLAGAWLLLPAAAQSTFAATYGAVDPDLERRTLGWAILFALMQIAIGNDGRPTYKRVGESALARAVEGSDAVG